MSYIGISVRDALNKLNAPNNGWFLPEVQRQYVWGARYESEEYVCLLLDSLVKGYPIGGIVLWETEQKVPYREFMKNYTPGDFPRLVDEGRWGAAKSLVYDGQQRLQTLYSVLYNRFIGRVLYFDLLFDAEEKESDDTGFLFRDAEAAAEPQFLRLTRLMGLRCDLGKKIGLEEELLGALPPDPSKKMLIRRNIDALWDIFVDTKVNSIAYFRVQADTPKTVNEVFRRLNTGGVALTQNELVFSKIKAKYFDYEENLWKLSERIWKKTGRGIAYSSADILQFFHLLIKGSTRVDEDRIEPSDVELFHASLNDDADSLNELFEGYLHGLYRINHASILHRWLAVLPIAVYLAHRKRAGHKWRIRELQTENIDRYFILSQFCDWNTQTMVNAFARIAIEYAKKGEPFPFTEIAKIAVAKYRSGALLEDQFLSQPWLATKLLTPGRTYVFHENKPQVDHIFPIKLAGKDEHYQDLVNVLWNLQPMRADINNFKRARHPKEFFTSDEGAKCLVEYDFLPPMASPVWDDPLLFIAYRREKMCEALRQRYGLSLEKMQNEVTQ